MASINRPLNAVYPEEMLDKVLSAMLDGTPHVIELKNGNIIRGWIWEIYRSIETRSVRFRCSDDLGYVYHYNMFDIVAMS